MTRNSSSNYPGKGSWLSHIQNTSWWNYSALASRRDSIYLSYVLISFPSLPNPKKGKKHQQLCYYIFSSSFQSLLLDTFSFLCNNIINFSCAFSYSNISIWENTIQHISMLKFWPLEIQYMFIFYLDLVWRMQLMIIKGLNFVLCM